jgi:hypothetical protein
MPILSLSRRNSSVFRHPSSAGDAGTGMVVPTAVPRVVSAVPVPVPVPVSVGAGQAASVSVRVSVPLSQPVTHDRPLRAARLAAAAMARVRVRSTAPAARI